MDPSYIKFLGKFLYAISFDDKNYTIIDEQNIFPHYNTFMILKKKTGSRGGGGSDVQK